MHLLFIALLTGCGPENRVEGIAVGNPGTFKPNTASAARITFGDSYSRFAQIELVDCEDNALVLAENISLGLLGDASLSFPAGTWCALHLIPDGVLFYAADGERGGFAEIYLAIEPFSLTNDAGFTVDGQPFILELATPDWLTEEDLGIDGGDDVQIKTEAPIHDVLADIIETESSLYEDTNGDGLIDEDDQLQADTVGAFASKSAGGASSAGCATMPLRIPTGLPLLIVFALRRRLTRAAAAAHRRP
ncbi:MAG: hypothetical protein AAFV53_36460 [Myxococcota bacterium]